MHFRADSQWKVTCALIQDWALVKHIHLLMENYIYFLAGRVSLKYFQMHILFSELDFSSIIIMDIIGQNKYELLKVPFVLLVLFLLG